MTDNCLPYEPECGPIRPPSEADSLLIRVVRNCPWNRCSFCPVYKGEKFSLRTLEEILNDLDYLSSDLYALSSKSVFLQDADALITPVDSLLKIIDTIRRTFPHVRRITAYARSNTLSNRKESDLRQLHDAGLSRIHVGIESHCKQVLELVRKGTTPEKQIQGCLRARDAGLELCCYVMPGVGGKTFSERHAIETGQFIARIQPDHVRLRTCFVLEGTPLAEDFARGLFKPLDEEETVREVRLFLEQLTQTRTELISDHHINLLMELRGSLPENYGQLLGIIDRFLDLPPESRKLFIAGRRLGFIRRLDDLSWADKDIRLKEAALGYKACIPVREGVL